MDGGAPARAAPVSADLAVRYRPSVRHCRFLVCVLKSTSHLPQLLQEDLRDLISCLFF